MSFKPVIIDVGVFKQLPSGEALDAGGWDLPTAGGTEDYALIADASGNAVWAQPDHGDQAGLGDDDHPQYVLNNGETSNVDLGSQTITTTGTVVGSNIPAPTAANQMLQSSAADVAAWSTDVTGLTSLTVDNIAIDGATILSTTGTVGFGDDNISTTADVICTNLIVTGNIETVNYIQFNTSFSDGHAEGRLHWDTDDGTLEVGMPGGSVKLQIGQEHIIRCRNVSGSTILNGTPVYVSGVQSNRPTIEPADASVVTTSGVLGLTTEDISNNSNGYVTSRGLVRGVNTTAFNEGDFVWLDASPGGITATLLDAPYSRVAIGDVIRKHADEGIIAVRIILIHRYEVASGIKLESNTDGDFLRWDAANNWWDRQGDSSIDHGSISGIEDDDHPQYQWKTGWELNYALTGKTVITVDGPGLEISIAPTGDDFEFWVEGIKYTKTTTQTASFTDTEGIWFVYFDNTGTLVTSQTSWDINANNWAGVCIIYWDATNKLNSLVGPEYHSYAMNPGTHHYLHYTFGTRWESGLGVAINGDNLDIGAGKIHDEDIEINITDSAGGGMWEQSLTPASLPIFYRSGVGAWRVTAEAIVPVYLDTNVPQVNVDSGGGNWIWEAVTVNGYFAYWVIASNDRDTPVVLVPGQESSSTLTGAQDGNKLADMNFGDLPVVEAKVIARVILRRQVSSPYYDLIEVDDYRQAVDEPAGGGSIVGDHGNLTGLGDNDHPQYLMYSGAVANLDMGTYTITTTGTVVGSNIPAPTVAAKVLTSTGIGTATWQAPSGGVTDHGALTGLGDDDHPQYVTYSGASGTVNLGSQELTTTSRVVGSNIPTPTLTDKILMSTGANTATWQDPSFGHSLPSPSASGKALVSDATDVAAWYTTSLYDVLKIDTPTASGAERIYVITADSASNFVIESAPWPINATSNETIYVDTAGNDTTGDGSSGNPFLTVTRAIEFVGSLHLGPYTALIYIQEGFYAENTLSFSHLHGPQITFFGISEQISSQLISSIGSTASYGHSNLSYREVTLVLPVGKSIEVGQYIGLSFLTGGVNPYALIGMHKVSDWVSGTRTATIQVAFRDGSGVPSGVITGRADLMKTILTFAGQTGISLEGPTSGGTWYGLVLEGDYSGSGETYGVRVGLGASVTLDGTGNATLAFGVSGFYVGLYSEKSSSMFANQAFVSKSGIISVLAKYASALSIKAGRINGTNLYGIAAHNGSVIDAINAVVVGTGDNAVYSYIGSSLDVKGGFVGLGNTTTSLRADHWSLVEAAGTTIDAAKSPLTGGDNQGSYVII